MSKKQDELLDSNYDGIKEYDNDLPKWWRALFWITIIFAGVYYVYYEFGPGLSSDARLALQLEEIKKQSASAMPVASKGASSDELMALTKDASHLAQGKVVYDAKCAACHGALGEGLVGPNLTDEYTIHGSKITDIKMTIENGVLDKGMLAWKGLLSANEIENVAAYVFSLKGSNPANAKAPQGTKDNS